MPFTTMFDRSGERPGGGVARRVMSREATIDLRQRLCSIIIPPRWSAASAGSISAHCGAAPPQTILHAAQPHSLLTSFPFLSLFLNPKSLLLLDRLKPIAGA